MANTPIPFVDPPAWNPDTALTARVPVAAPDAALVLKPIVMGGGPPVFAASPAPVVTRTPTPLENQIGATDQQLRKLQAKDANPYGSANNHPGVGGKILHALSVAGNIAGDIFAPSTMALIPGTNLNREVQESGLGARLRALTEQQSADAARDAATDRTIAETAALPGENEEKKKLTDATVANLESETGARDAAAASPNLATAYAHAVEQALKNGQDPSKDPVVQHLSDAIVSLQPGQNKAAPTHFIQRQVDGVPHTIMVDDASGADIKDEGPTGVKPPVVNVNAGNARADRSYQYNNTELNTLGKPIADLQQRMIRLQDDLAQGTPQADALVAPQLLTVMAGGQGSGLRMNDAEISRIVGGRSNWESLKAAANKWSTDPASANSITTAQRQQIHALVATVAQRLARQQQILDDANQKLIDAPDIQTQRQIVADARKALNGDGGGDSGGKAFSLKQAMALPFNKGKSEADVRADLEKHGYTVTD